MAEAAKAAMDGDRLDGPLALSLTFTLPIPASWSKRKRAEAVKGLVQPASKPDIDNLAKAIMDGINSAEIVWRDDCQITWLTVRKAYGLTPSVSVRIVEAVL